MVDVREDKPEGTPQRGRRIRTRWLWLAVPPALVVGCAAAAMPALRDPARPVAGTRRVVGIGSVRVAGVDRPAVQVRYTVRENYRVTLVGWEPRR